MLTSHRTAALLLLLSGLGLLGLGWYKLETPASAQPRGPAGTVDMTADPNMLLSDMPSTDFVLEKRRLGDAADSGNKTFNEMHDFPFRYGVTNGKITSMLCPGERLKGIDVEPSAAGLQMRLGKADEIVEGDEETILYWFAKKRAASVADGELQWFAVYK